VSGQRFFFFFFFFFAEGFAVAGAPTVNFAASPGVGLAGVLLGIGRLILVDISAGVTWPLTLLRIVLDQLSHLWLWLP
jgi:hypothetical protein